MQVICVNCERRLEWSAKRDKRLAELACPHCGGRYRKPADYKDWLDPAFLVKRADDAATRLRQTTDDLLTALDRTKRLPHLICEAQDLIELLRKQSLAMLPRTAAPEIDAGDAAEIADLDSELAARYREAKQLMSARLAAKAEA